MASFQRAARKIAPYEPACFPAGTLVHTNEGLKPIETIQVGDFVLSRPENSQGEREYKRVTQTFVHEDREIIMMFVGGTQSDGSKRWQELIVTPEHPIWVQGKGWKKAQDIKMSIVKPNQLELLSSENSKVTANNRLFVTSMLGIAWMPRSSATDHLSSNGYHVDVASQKIVRNEVFIDFESVLKTHQVKPEHLFRATVYNIEVEDFHTYYVGEAGILVHNKLNRPG